MRRAKTVFIKLSAFPLVCEWNRAVGEMLTTPFSARRFKTHSHKKWNVVLGNSCVNAQYFFLLNNEETSRTWNRNFGCWYCSYSSRRAFRYDETKPVLSNVFRGMGQRQSLQLFTDVFSKKKLWATSFFGHLSFEHNLSTKLLSH